MMHGTIENLHSWMNGIRSSGPPRGGGGGGDGGGQIDTLQLALFLLDAALGDVDSFLRMLNCLSDHVQDQLDTFSSDTLRGIETLDPTLVRETCTRYRHGLLVAQHFAVARQLHAPVEPRQIYPGRLAGDLICALLGHTRKSAARSIFERARELEPDIWSGLEKSLGELLLATRGWTRWPSPWLAEEIRSELEAAAPSWAAALSEARVGGKQRARWKDPAFRRAASWHALLVRIFAQLAVPEGNARLSLEYAMAALERCCDHARELGQPGRFPVELAIIEVFSNVERGLGFPSPQLEVGSPCRRKRIQRARLQVLVRWPATMDDRQWIDEFLPRLVDLGERARCFDD